MSGNCDIPITITVTKHSITGQPANLPDGVVQRIAYMVDCSIFGQWFDDLFQAMPSPLTEDYRRLSVDRIRHGS